MSTRMEKSDEIAADHQVARARTNRRHCEMLVAATVVVVLAFLLEVHSDQRVAFSILPSCPLPHTCLSRSLLHIECPGCGLTRSFVYLAHGDWRESWNVHRVGWFVALAVVLQIPYRLVALRSPSGLPLGTTAPRLFGILLIVLLIVNWLINLLSRLLVR